MSPSLRITNDDKYVTITMEVPGHPPVVIATCIVNLLTHPAIFKAWKRAVTDFITQDMKAEGINVIITDAHELN